MRWLVADSLGCPGQFFCGHLDSYGHYLAEAGEEVIRACLNFSYDALGKPSGHWFDGESLGDGRARQGVDIAFFLDGYAIALKVNARKRIAQCAAITNPLPWEVRKPDGSPAFDLVLSSIPAMVEQARAAGCRAEYMALAFDLRARACMIGVKRENKAIFIGTRGPNHRRREELLTELADIVEVVPPVFGREYFKALAGATVLFQPHAEWARGCANSMKLYEGAGMGAAVVSDGEIPDEGGPVFGWNLTNAKDAREAIEEALDMGGAEDEAIVLQHHTYEHRIPRLIELARSL